MSRRERHTRDSDSRRHRSGFDREPSPKRSRRDGKPEKEKTPANTNLNVDDTTARDRKHRPRLQDALPLEASSVPDSKVESGAVSKDSEKKSDRRHEGSKQISDPTDVPRSRSYFQHDERGNAAQVGRSFGWRATNERRWKDSKDDKGGRALDKSSKYSSEERDGRLQAKGDDGSVWRHDNFFRMEAETAAPVRKRPAFREKKIPVDSENAEKQPIEPPRPNHYDDLTSESKRWDERNSNGRYSDRFERPVPSDRREAWRGGLGERFSSAGRNYRERERFNGRQGYRPGGTRPEKWKHDMFDEANKSPATRNEEDQIAKVEALLAS